MIELLQKLIAIPSFSGEEDGTASLLFDDMARRGFSPQRSGNNVWARSLHFDGRKPTLLLNSHHDTVRPSASYTRDPFVPAIENGRLYGLGSNDAGASVAAMIGVFGRLYRMDLNYNIVIAITAEEETICENGISALLPGLGRIDCAVVGEPTRMQAAVAERGLLVLDCTSHGRPGHAAREEGKNALYEALPDIEWFRTFRFPRVSEALGEVKMTVTQLRCGHQHNVVPDTCLFVVDVRPTEQYTNEQIVEIVRRHVKCDVQPRSVRLNASCLPSGHLLERAARKTGFGCYVSPTTSDIARMPFPAIKIGPGDSARSHTADEFVYVDEVYEGVERYEAFLLAVNELNNENTLG